MSTYVYMYRHIFAFIEHIYIYIYSIGLHTFFFLSFNVTFLVYYSYRTETSESQEGFYPSILMFFFFISSGKGE